MQRMTISGALGAMFDFIRSSWHVVLGGLLSALVVVSTVGGALGYAASSASPAVSTAVSLASGLVLYIAMFASLFLGWRHGLTDSGESVIRNIGWALGASAASMLAMSVVAIILSLAFYAVLLVVGLIAIAIFGFGGANAGDIFSPTAAAGMGAGAIVLFILLYTAAIVGYLWIYGRLSVAGPAMAVQRTRNPLAGLGSSWKLTKGSQWRIVGFYAILSMVGFVLLIALAIAVQAIGGATPGANGTEPSGTALVLSLIPLLALLPAMLLSAAAPAAVYRQVADGERTVADIFA